MEEAVRSGNLDRLQELVQGGADVNASYKGMPLLSLAIKVGHNEIALELIERGANVHAKDRQGMTALHWACKVVDREVVVQRLVDRGCSVNEEDGRGRTPLLLAAKWGGQRGIANCLLKAGASCEPLPTKQKNLVIRYACLESDVFVVESLIKNGCDINTTFATGKTLLIQAVEAGCEDIVKVLIQEGTQLDVQDPKGCTALHYAALNGYTQCGVLLIEGGASAEVKDKRSQTALNIAGSGEFKEAIEQARSFTVSKILAIVGDTGVGKSTLIAALQAERNSFFGRTLNRVKRVSDQRNRTAGIETIHHHSQRYGEVLFFDFAGQHKYYGPHQPFLESFLSKAGVSMTLLMVVKATDREKAIREQLYYWLFPVVQMATTAATPPQVIVIGSFLDQVESKDAAVAKLQRCMEATSMHLNDIFPLKFAGSCLLNCRQPQSEGIVKLCGFLQEVPTPKLKAIHTQYSLAWVLSQIKLAFTDQLAIQLHTLAKWMQENRDNLPQIIPSPEEVCKDLSAAGHALYLQNKDNCHNSWLVLDLANILQVVYGTLFSQPKETINRFGLLHCQELARLFPQMCLEMVQQLLISLEFCTPIDLTVLSEDVKKLTTSAEDNGWLFFPAFVSAEPPKVLSEGCSQQSVSSLWWQLRACEKHFIFARVFQTILLHLAAHIVVRHDSADGVQEHCCRFWQNGIAWQSKEGVDITVHITNSELQVVGTSEETADRLCQYLTEVIDDILSTVHKISPNLKADAYIVHRPVRVAVPCKEFELVPPSEEELFPVADIEKSITESKIYSLSRKGADDRSSKKTVSDLFAGHTPSVEDIVKILWRQHGPIRAQSAILTAQQPQCTPTLLDVSSTPTLNDISELGLAQVAARWQFVATHLRVEPCIVNIILKNHPNDCERACLDMLNRWLSKERHTGKEERTWSTLLTALGKAVSVVLEQRLRREHFKAE